jgi:outer membrane protein OmpA-like peptidoglycan-associated protein
MKSLRMSLVVLTVLLLQGLSAPGTATSEPGGLHLNLTPFGGYATWAKDVNLDDKPMFGGRVGIGFGRHLGVEGYYSWMKTHTEYGSGDSLFTAASLTAPSDQSIQGYGADLTLNLFPSIAFNPYVLGGWHEEKIKSDVSSVETFMNGLEFGGGVKLGLGRKAAIRLEIRDKFWKFDSPPAPDPPGDKNVSNLFYSGGIQITLGGSGGDRDKDGVSDKDDKCPDTPRGAQVDVSGCPLDSDGDHVPDGIDQCPNTPAGATVDARGCPSDADNDGVFDGIDQCPGTPAGTTVDARGCTMDSDGDGVPDGVDKCANTPAGAKVDATGCPVDSDGDGVPDGIDQCPGTPAGTQVDPRGCSMDSDNDGVTDDKDLCPNTQANVRVDKDGCPIEISEKEVELLDKGRITVREIHFETAKADIAPESGPVLDEIGTILIQWPRLKIEVGGHTDARGSDAYNQQLSEKRAQAVLDYLTQKFPQIPRDQYTAKGYGELKPVATNKTALGMAKNRRVEFKVLNTEELTKEKERRRLLKKGE